MKPSELYKVVLVAALISLVPMSGYASPNRGPGPQGAPPPEAIEACEGMSEGDSVEFTGPRGETLTGICKEIDGQLAAAPEDGGRGPRRQ